MPVKGDDIWNSVMADVEREATAETQAGAEEVSQQRADSGVLSQVGGAIQDARNAAFTGAASALFETKDFILGEPEEKDKSLIRSGIERERRELQARSKWNGAVASISQFVTGFVGAGKVMPFAKGGMLKDAGRAAGVGAVAFDPEEDRLSNFIQSFPALQNPVTNYLAAKPEDSKAAGRLKNAVESLAMDGVAAVAVLAAAKVIKLTRAGDKAGATAARKELDDANIKLGQQEVAHHRRQFMDQETTTKAQADIGAAQLLRSGATADDQAPGMAKSFVGDDEVVPSNTPSGLGGRAEALDREMRQAPDMSEVPGAGDVADVPTAVPTPKPFGGGGMAEALDREMRGQQGGSGQSADALDEALPGPQAAPEAQVDVPAAQLPTDGQGRPLAPDVRDAARVAPDNVPPAEQVSNVTPEARGMRADNPRGPVEATPEQIGKYVEAARKDDDAVAKAGSYEEALQDGHRFARAGTIPWQKIGETPDGLRGFVAEVVDVNKDVIGAARGGNADGVLRDTKVDKLADQLSEYYGIDPRGYFGQLKQAGDAARAMVVHNETAMRISKAGFTEAYEMLRRIDAGNLGGYGSKEEALAAFGKQVQLATDVYAQARAMQAASGRLLRRSREEFAVRADQMAKVKAAQMDPETLAQMFRASGGDPTVLAKLTRPNIISQIVDGVRLFHISNILSGPSTQVVNAVSNVALLGFRPLTSYVGATMKHGYAAMTKNDVMAASAKVLRLRSKVELVSTVSTLTEGREALKKAFLLGDSIMAPHNSSEAFETLTGGVGGDIRQMPWRDWNSIDDVIANGLKGAVYVGTADLRLMGSVDEAVKTMRYRAVINGHTAVEADLRGIKPGTKQFKDLLKQRADAAFDENGRAIDADALQEAKVTANQQDLKLDPIDTWGGYQTLGSAASNFLSNVPIARLIVPFIKTPTNLFRYGVKLTPGINLLQKEYLNSLRGVHGEMRQATAIGEMAMGIVLLSSGVHLRLMDRITGSGPNDPKQTKDWKAQGNLPYAVRVGDGPSSFQINRFDPIQMPVALAADFVDMFLMHQNKGDMETLENVASAMVLSLAHQLKDKTYYKGASDFLDAIGDEHKVKSYAERFIPGFIPGVSLLRHVNQDPYVHEINGMVDAIKASIPGYSDTLPVRYDALGRPVKVPGKFIGTKDYDSPLAKALDEQFAMTGTSLTAAQPKSEGVDLREVTLEKDGANAFEAYNKLISKPKGVKVDLEKALEKIVTSKQYAAAPHGEAGTANTKEYMVAHTINSYRAAAMAQLKSENPDLREKLGQRARDSYNKAMAGKKNLKSVEANVVGRQLNNLLNSNGFGSVPIPQPMQE